MESMDQENLPEGKKELLRQMSSPNRPKDNSRANLNRKVQPGTKETTDSWQVLTLRSNRHLLLLIMILINSEWQEVCWQ